MRGKLIAAVIIAACSLAVLLHLAAREAAPTLAELPTIIPSTVTEEVTMPETTVPTAPPDPIVEQLRSMTLEEKVGQLFLARCPETDCAAEGARCHLGGYVLFGRDFDGRTPDSLRNLLTSCQDAARIPMLIAVDEEGGTVTRVSNHRAFAARTFQSPRSLYRQGGMELVLSTEAEKAQLLHSRGINVNLAPVCDLSDRSGAFMYQRSLGESPEIVSEFVAGVIRAMAQWNVGAVMKHFPGYGNNADTHTGIAVDRRSLAQLEQADVQPFFAGISAGGGAILVSHTIVEAIDPKLPASLSPEMHHYLRLAMGFDGVIITDDLAMDAITEQYGAGESAVLAVLAGNDLLCSTEYSVQIDAVLDACRSGRIREETVDAAALHVLQWKQSLGLLPANSGN